MPLKYSEYATQVLEQRSLRKLLESCIIYLRLSIVFLCGISYYLTVLFVSRNRPTISIDDFHVSLLNKTSNSFTNTTTIYIDLKIQHENLGMGIYYEDPLNLTITYIPQTKSRNDTSVTIGKHNFQGFYQGNGKVTHIRASVVVLDLFSKAEQRRKLGETFVSLLPPAKVLDFMVYVDAKIKFKWNIENKKSDLMVGSAVEVNQNTGNFVLNKTIQLNYLSGSDKWGAVQWLLFLPLFISFMVATFIAVLLPLLLVLVFFC